MIALSDDAVMVPLVDLEGLLGLGFLGEILPPFKTAAVAVKVSAILEFPWSDLALVAANLPLASTVASFDGAATRATPFGCLVRTNGWHRTFREPGVGHGGLNERSLLFWEGRIFLR